MDAAFAALAATGSVRAVPVYGNARVLAVIYGRPIPTLTVTGDADCRAQIDALNEAMEPLLLNLMETWPRRIPASSLKHICNGRLIEKAIECGDEALLRAAGVTVNGAV